MLNHILGKQPGVFVMRTALFSSFITLIFLFSNSSDSKGNELLVQHNFGPYEIEYRELLSEWATNIAVQTGGKMSPVLDRVEVSADRQIKYTSPERVEADILLFAPRPGEELGAEVLANYFDPSVFSDTSIIASSMQTIHESYLDDNEVYGNFQPISFFVYENSSNSPGELKEAAAMQSTAMYEQTANYLQPVILLANKNTWNTLSPQEKEQLTEISASFFSDRDRVVTELLEHYSDANLSKPARDFLKDLRVSDTPAYHALRAPVLSHAETVLDDALGTADHSQIFRTFESVVKQKNSLKLK